MSSRLVQSLAAAALTCIVAVAANAHEGHDHGSDAPRAPASVAPRGEASSEKLELVAVAQGTTLVFYLDDVLTNTPIERATLDVETPDGPQAATPVGQGVYRLDAPFLAKGGHIDLIVTVSVGDLTDILSLSVDLPERNAADSGRPVGGIARTLLVASIQSPLAAGLIGFGLGAVMMAVIGRRRRVAAMMIAIGLIAVSADAKAHDGHGDEKPAVITNDERALRQPDGTVFVPKPVQRILDLRTTQLQNGQYRRAVELPGRVIPDPGASGVVQTAVGGVLSPPPGGFPRLGATVKAGDVLAYVTAPLQAIDVSDMRQKQGELDQQIAIVQRRLSRQESLVTTGAVARSQVEETRLELDGLRDRRAGLESVRSEPVPLVAPVSGLIADGTPVNGQVAQTNAIVFHIISPEKLWIEALSFDPIGGAMPASAKVANGQILKLEFRGSGLSDRSQSIPVHYAIEKPGNGLRAGQFVTVFTETGDARNGVAVPRSAIVRGSNGQDFVYEHTSAERFAPRAVRFEPLDAERVVILGGIEPGKRVVVQGAELLDHVR